MINGEVNIGDQCMFCIHALVIGECRCGEDLEDTHMCRKGFRMGYYFNNPSKSCPDWDDGKEDYDD